MLDIDIEVNVSGNAKLTPIDPNIACQTSLTEDRNKQTNCINIFSQCGYKVI